MALPIDNRIYVWSKEKDLDKAKKLKNKIIENNFERILDVRILHPEHDVVMQNAYDVHDFPSVIILDDNNQYITRYIGTFESIENKIIKREIELD